MLYRFGCTLLVAGFPAFALERLNNQVGYIGSTLIVAGAAISMIGTRLINR